MYLATAVSNKQTNKQALFENCFHSRLQDSIVYYLGNAYTIKGYRNNRQVHAEVTT